ncbi:ubiquitin-conjugating enzyme/RWD-like protein [Phascolomyces articulosus]|uniref:E2 ubiquitin-conjugating enzyme n=1 Tax=Phascolomyces articulosus TaxID=60185 RepID=A0AAD5JPF0_9FUNG|nr:ubiquitin-conjugating enzyme/RWD-like protein [Phascolomyces articulosus]
MATRSELAPQALKKIAKELQSLERSPPEDIQVLNNEQDLTEIQAWIRGPDGTPYENGYFKVKLLLNEGYPETAPKGYFTTKIFHPNVASNGEICVNTLKKDWKAELGIAHVLLTVKCLLIVPNPESALNEEAGKLLLEQYGDYAKRAKLYTTIHAKSGKSEFQKLSAERTPSISASTTNTSQQQEHKVSEENKKESKSSSVTVNTAPQNENPNSGSSTTTPSGKQKEEANTSISTATSVSTITATVPNGSSNNVLTPSAVGNNAVQMNNMKRPSNNGEGQDGKDDVEAPCNKQPRVETLPKKKSASTADRKKRLRRL